MHELMALDALGALTADERIELDAAIADRPDLREELASLRDTAATMADAVAEEPPATLLGSVLAAIAVTPQLPGEQRDVEPTAEPEPPLAPVVSITSGRRRRFWAVGAAAAAIIAIVVGALAILPTGDDPVDDEVAAVLDDPDAVTIPMPATPDGGLTGSIAIVYSQREGAVVVQGDDLPAPEGNGVYQLWAIRGGTPEPVDVTFRPDDGEAEIFVAGFDPGTADAWAVTQEPGPGAQTPTLPILAQTSA